MKAIKKELKLIIYPSWIMICILLFSAYFISDCSDKNKNLKDTVSKKIVPDSLDWSVRMADSEIYRCKDSLEFGGGDPKAKWNYQTGLFLKALVDLGKKTNDPKYKAYVKKVIDSFIEADGSIAHMPTKLIEYYCFECGKKWRSDLGTLKDVV